MNMTLEVRRRRLYFKNAPFAVKDRLKSFGASWDAEQRAWYVGLQKKSQAEQFVQELQSAPEEETLGEAEVRIVGRATYQGQSYYVLWHGEREGEPIARLSTRDGKRLFWAKGSELSIDKLYRKPTSISALKAFVERKAREAKTGVCECRCHSRSDCTCPHFCHYHHDGCDGCGCES